jgi:hypothetical protein
MGGTKWTQVYTMPAERGAMSRSIENDSSADTESLEHGVPTIPTGEARRGGINTAGRLAHRPYDVGGLLGCRGIRGERAD